MRLGAALLPLVAMLACATANTSYLAKVNGQELTGAQLRREFGRRHKGLDSLLIEDAAVRKVVVRAADRRVMLEEGYRMGLQDAPEVRSQLAEVRRDKMMARLVRDEVEDRSLPTDEEARAAYALSGTSLMVRQVVVRTREEAEAIAAKLRGGGDAEAIARASSIVHSAKMGGVDRLEWGAAAPGETRERLLWPLKEGEVSPPYETPEGWEVDRIETRETPPADERFTFEEQEDKIRVVLKNRKARALEEAFFGALWTKYDARLLDCAPNLAALKAAKEKPDESACATWTGGALPLREFARRTRLDQLEAAGEARYPELRKAILEELASRELVKLEAEARGYGQRPDVVEDVRAAEEELVETKLFKEYVLKDVQPDEAAVKAYYEAHLPEFMTQDRFSIAQIVVESPEKAKEVQEKLATESFEKLAQAYSKDPRGADDGYIGDIDRSELKGDLAPIAALSAGQVSAPIQTERGYHLLKVLRIEPARQQALEEVKDQVRAKSLEERRAAAIARWLKPLKEASRIEINDPGIHAYVIAQRKAMVTDEAEHEAKAKRKEAAAKARIAARDARKAREAEEAKAKEAKEKEAAAADPAAPAAPAAATPPPEKPAAAEQKPAATKSPAKAPKAKPGKAPAAKAPATTPPAPN